MFREERVETERAIKFEREPAPAPLPGTRERELIQPDLHPPRVIGGRGVIMRKERDLSRRVGVRGVNSQRLAPGRALGIIALPG